MAYIYKKNGHYYAFDNLGDDLADISYSVTEGFVVDTILAYPISVLNNKGYTTLQCCEGHPLVNAYYEHIDEYKQRMYCDNSDIDKMFDIRENDDGEKYVCFQGDPDVGAFIIFDEAIKLKTIPNGWEYENDNSIRWYCENYANPTDYYKKLILVVESLTTWAEQLCEFHNP